MHGVLMINTKHIMAQGKFIEIENNQIISKIINITNQHQSKYQYNNHVYVFFIERNIKKTFIQPLTTTIKMMTIMSMNFMKKMTECSLYILNVVFAFME